MKTTLAFSLLLMVVTSCIDYSDYNDGSIHKINCDNLSEMEIPNHPKEIDRLIQKEIIEHYKDSAVTFRLLGNVYYDLNLENCEIDKSMFNAQIQVKIGSKFEYWQISFKKKNHTYIRQVFFKRSDPK